MEPYRDKIVGVSLYVGYGATTLLVLLTGSTLSRKLATTLSSGLTSILIGLSPVFTIDY
jgi:hypothetical protein